MSTTAERLVSMINQHLDLDREPDMNKRLRKNAPGWALYRAFAT